MTEKTEIQRKGGPMSLDHYYRRESASSSGSFIQTYQSAWHHLISPPVLIINSDS